MTKPLFPKSVRKHIRFQKAHIRREFSDVQKQQELIQELYQRFVRKPEKKEEKVKEEPASSAVASRRSIRPARRSAQKRHKAELVTAALKEK